MFASIDEAVEYWKDELSYVDDAKVTGYVGGYPVVEPLQIPCVSI